MGQKANPAGLKLGYNKGRNSNLYGGKAFAQKLVGDQEIRKLISAHIPKGIISKVVVERTLKRITLKIYTTRQSGAIEKSGKEFDIIREELKKLTGKVIQINIYELKRHLDTQLVDNKGVVVVNMEILKAINEAKNLLLLNENWDEDGALAISKNIWNNAISFLKNYSEYMLSDKKLSIKAPQINPCRDGSIDLSWRTSKARMLINFKNDGNNLAHYYGDHYENVNSIKGYVKIDDIQDFLATWMKILA